MILQGISSLKYTVLCLVIYSTTNAHAGVFKCVGADGKKRFQSTPCASPSMKQSEVRIINQSTLPAVKHQSKSESLYTVPEVRNSDAASYEALMAEKEHERKVQFAITMGELVEGMTFTEVRRAWGKPCWAKKYDYGLTQWQYCRDNQRWRDDVYIYFDQAGKYTGRNGPGKATKRFKGNWR